MNIQEYFFIYSLVICFILQIDVTAVVLIPGICVFMQTLTTVHHHPVKTEAPASTELTPSSVSAQTAGRAACVMSVSVCVCV